MESLAFNELVLSRDYGPVRVDEQCSPLSASLHDDSAKLSHVLQATRMEHAPKARFALVKCDACNTISLVLRTGAPCQLCGKGCMAPLRRGPARRAQLMRG